MNDIFVLLRFQDYPIRFRDYLDKYHRSMSFFWATKKQKTFLDEVWSHEGNKFVTTVYRKRTFHGTFSGFVLPSTYKFSKICTLIFRCFWIFLYWNKFFKRFIIFFNKLPLLKDICSKNGYPALFIEQCFKTFLHKLFLNGPQILTVEKNTGPSASFSLSTENCKSRALRL